MRIFISAAEPSADAHGARLIEAVRRLEPKVRFAGVAGPKMVQAGCHCVFDMTHHSAMLLGVARVAGQAVSMRRVVDRLLRRMHFDAAVVIDSPTLHLPIAAQAHALGIAVLYYIAPQLWAWGTYRMHKLRNDVDRLAVILPFEEDFFRAHGVEATFVGHPLAEAWAERQTDPGGIAGVSRVEAIATGAPNAPVATDAPVATVKQRSAPVVALLPGSRKHVVQEVLPGQIEIARRVRMEFPKAAFGVSIANDSVRPIINGAIATSGVTISTDISHHDLIASAELALVASGTTSLEVAFHGTPMIVMYNASRLMHQLLGRWMIHTPFLSLPNILAGREIVPEFMPYYTSVDPIAAKAISLLRSHESRMEMRRQLETIVAPLRDSQASARTAKLLIALAGAER